MPLVITVISSERVRSGRNGRMVSGASVCPIKMLAATFSDSAPLAPMTRVMTQATMLDDDLHDAEVIEHGEKCGDENDRWQYSEGESSRVASPACRGRQKRNAIPRRRSSAASSPRLPLFEIRRGRRRSAARKLRKRIADPAPTPPSSSEWRADWWRKRRRARAWSTGQEFP